MLHHPFRKALFYNSNITDLFIISDYFGQYCSISSLLKYMCFEVEFDIKSAKSKQYSKRTKWRVQGTSEFNIICDN